MKRRWIVCFDADVEDEEIEAERMWYTQDTGWLTFSNGGMPVAVFAPGKWVYFKEVADAPR